MSDDATEADVMRLRIILPTHVLLNVDAIKIVAEAANGSFGVLPRHIDFVAALQPALLSFIDKDGHERFVGHDEGIFVKQGRRVLVSVRRAVQGENLATLREIVRSEIMALHGHEQKARSALARLEAGIVRQFIEFEER